MMDDLDKIMAVMSAAFDPLYGEAWSRRQVEDALNFAHTHYFLIATNGKPPAEGEAAAGFALSRTGFGEEELLLLAVDPAQRCRGLGKLLLDDLRISAKKRGAARLLLEMRKGNTAESLYRTFGFSPIGLRKEYYRTTEGDRIDAITFACDIG